jgi:Ca2+-binding RTX toxin-like protein
VAVADLNNDGNLDLVTANLGPDTVSLLGGSGAGGFSPFPGAAPAVGLGAGADPTSVAVADLNNDGNQDWVTANFSPDTVSVLIGNGGGGFSSVPVVTLGAGADPTSVAVADLNADGKQDLATANRGADTVSVLLGIGGGGFSPAPAVALGAGADPASVAVGDLSNDGNLDLVTANPGLDTVSVLLGNGAGGFGAAPAVALGAGADPFSVAVGDLNNDGNQDLATANDGQGPDTVSVLLGNGAGGFNAAPAVALGAGLDPLSVAVGDLNNDGNADLVTANLGPDTVSALLGNGAGAFNVAPGAAPGVGADPVFVAVGDLNNDANQDLVTANNGPATVSVLLGNGPSPRVGNLLVNPGAEGPGAAGSAAATPAFGGWTRTAGTPTFVRYASTGGFPSLIDAARWGGGTNFFTGGIGPSASAEQTVSVADRAASIDAGLASASLSGLLGGYSNGADAASLSATFLGVAGKALGPPLAIGPLSAADRRNQTVLLRRTAGGAIPAGTRSIRVVMSITRQSGTYNDGYLDDLSLRLAAPAPPIVTVGSLPRCAGKRATIVAKGRVTRGTPKADVIVGRTGPDTIRARGGNDIVCGRGGADLIEGGPGKDRLLGGPGADRLRGGAGRDVLLGGPGRDRLLGGGALDRLVGGPGRDRQAQ